MTKTQTKTKNGKGGRPRLHGDVKLSVPFNTRLSVPTHQKLIAQANAAHLSEHDFVRALIDGAEVRSPHRGKDPDLVDAIRALERELNAIGNNVNQIALAVNSGRDIQYYWREIGDQLRGVLDTVLDKVDA